MTGCYGLACMVACFVCGSGPVDEGPLALASVRQQSIEGQRQELVSLLSGATVAEQLLCCDSCGGKKRKRKK